MTPSPDLDTLIDRIKSAQAAGTALQIRGGNTKAFYGEAAQGEPLDTSVLRRHFQLRADRAGGHRALRHAAGRTGGQRSPRTASACPSSRHASARAARSAAWSRQASPARRAPLSGAVRDFMLGATLLNGRGEVLSFGGQVMKNVAGYDVSRLLAGSLGTLGVILEVSLKVLPVAPASVTLRFEMDEGTAIQRLNEWVGPAASDQCERLVGRHAGAAPARRASRGAGGSGEARR